MKKNVKNCLRRTVIFNSMIMKAAVHTTMPSTREPQIANINLKQDWSFYGLNRINCADDLLEHEKRKTPHKHWCI